jgi:hypothetical protein
VSEAEQEEEEEQEDEKREQYRFLAQFLVKLPLLMTL